MASDSLSGPPPELDEKSNDLVVKFLSSIRNSKLEGASKIALATITLLEQIISDSNTATAFELCTLVRAVGRAVSGAMPEQLVPGNLVRRVLRVIRDEYRNQPEQSAEGSSLQGLVLGAGQRRGTLARTRPQIDNLREHIAELRQEVESSVSIISGFALEHAHTDELIMTYGPSHLTEMWLMAAAPRSYRLILAESTDLRESAAMSVRLSDAGIPVTYINSVAVTALMSRVNKVVVEVSAVLAGGGVLCPIGAAAVTLAAKFYSVPVIALAPLYKLTPLHNVDCHRFNAQTAPHHGLPYDTAESADCPTLSPLYDRIPADHITLFLTNLGGSSPSYIYRLLQELYDPNDYEL